MVSGYALTFGLALVPAGRLGDAFGRRRMFLVALTGFVVCSAAAGAAQNIGLLVAARLAQGVAAGALAPQNSALIQQLFRGAERGRAFGLFGATVGISTAAGPVARRRHPRAGRGPRRLALDLLRQRADRARRAGARRAAAAPRDGRAGGGTSTSSGVALLGGGVLALMLPLVRPSRAGWRGCGGCSRSARALLAAFARGSGGWCAAAVSRCWTRG